jgi:HEAT repeat protein
MKGFRRCWAIPLMGLALGCGVGPRHFRSLADPSPLARARAAGLGGRRPEAEVIPALIGRLDDRDPVVRLSANEALRKRTGQDFGFVAWAEPQERAKAVARWQNWWNGRQGGLANSRQIP